MRVQTEMAGGSMKRSSSAVADQRVNGLRQEEKKSPDRLYRPRHKSYKAAGQSPLSTHVTSPLISSTGMMRGGIRVWFLYV